MSHKEMALESGATLRTIQKWVVEKHRLTNNLRKHNKNLNEKQKDLIVGSMLGDGHITNEKYIPIFIVSHASDEKEYLFWKHEILNDVCNKKPKAYNPKLKPFGSKTYLAKESYRINTRSLDALVEFRDMSIVDLVDRLNRLSLSIWLLDDGYRSNCNWELCVAPYTGLEIIHILKVQHNKFGLECKQKSDTRYIIFTAEASRKLDEIILAQIPNHLDVVKKKITEKNIPDAANYFWVDFDGEKIGLNRFCRKNGLAYLKAKNLYSQGVFDGKTIIETLKKVQIK